MERVVFSPDRSRVVVLTDMSSMGTGAPVLDAVLGSVAFFLPFRVSQGAAYSHGGDTLFAAGVMAGPNAGHHLFALTATGGILVDSTVPGGYGIWDLALDDTAPWLYALILSSPGWEEGVRVVDRRTLATVAHLPTIPACGHPCNGQRRLAVDAAARRLHVLITASFYESDGTSQPTVILDYSLPPVSQSPLTLEP